MSLGETGMRATQDRDRKDFVGEAEPYHSADHDIGAFGRLGNVLYWLGMGVAVLCFVAAGASGAFGTTNDAWIIAGFFAICGVCSALIGLALRYILAGPRPQHLRKSYLPSWRSVWTTALTVVVFTAGAMAVRYGRDYLKESEVGLKGKTRTSFVESAVESCERTQSAMRENVGVSKEVIVKYCACYSNRMADTLSGSDLKAAGPNPTVETMPVRFTDLAQKASDYCVETALK
jgi:hypothetical protein